MSKRLRKIINTSFLILFLLGYIGTIVTSSIVASLFDLKVYAEDEEVNLIPIESVSLENNDITSTISSNQTLNDWTDGDIYETEEYKSIAAGGRYVWP